MDLTTSPTNQAEPSRPRPEGLSYKFQRLRERLREAIASGEFAGKLPGERELARRFNANPKTLGKALIDLAAEGLLERRIGRGTYVRSGAPQRSAGRWLILHDGPEESDSWPIVQHLMQAHPEAQLASMQQTPRPSFLSQFNTVIDVSSRTTDEFHRSLLVRGMTVLLLGRTSSRCVVHSVLLDRTHAAWRLARDLFHAGHERILVIEPQGQTFLADGASSAAKLYAPSAVIRSAAIGDTNALMNAGDSAILCDARALEHIRRLAGEYPGLKNSSVAAVGIQVGQPTHTGIYVTPAELDSAACSLLGEAQMHRPVVLHLAGTPIDCGTIHPACDQRLQIRPTAALSA